MRMTTTLLFIILSPVLGAQEKYSYTTDLKNITDDKVSIELLTPAITTSEATFSFPRVIPGSYSEKNYGKYIDDFKAWDRQGKALKVNKLNKNQYQVQEAVKLQKITYKVNDTWDAPDKDFIFQPGGSNIESGSNIIMNNHAFYGYFEGYSMLPFEIKVIKPAEMYASTHLQVDRKSQEEDLLFANNYVYLADNPVFYCRPDTTSFVTGNSRINISVFSANGKVTSHQVAGYLQPMGNALQHFFNGLPVSSYQFLYYFEDPDKALIGKEKKGGGYGALEHNYSSLYFLPEMGFESRLKSMVNEVSSHEFLHILTPLNLHSEYIEHFDFINPIMSKHLWLYEGVTEYFAHLVQVSNGLIDEKTFFNNMRDKINDAEKYGDFSMTTMSEKVLGEYQDKYSSVYNRGALIGLMLDMFIREKTNYQKTLKSVVVELAGKYGAGKPFKDDAFLDEFVKASHPAVQQFVDDYITGAKPLPYAEYFNKLGYGFSPTKKVDIYFAGHFAIKYLDDRKAFSFSKVEKNALKIKEDDILVSVNDVKVTEDNIDEIWENTFMRNTSRTSMTMVVERDGKQKTLDGDLYKGYLESKNFLAPVTSPSDSQKLMMASLFKN